MAPNDWRLNFTSDIDVMPTEWSLVFHSGDGNLVVANREPKGQVKCHNGKVVTKVGKAKHSVQSLAVDTGRNLYLMA